MEPNKKSVNSTDPTPDPTPTAGQVKTKTTMTYYSFDDRIIESGNRCPSPSTTPNDPLGSPGTNKTTPVAASIGSK